VGPKADEWTPRLWSRFAVRKVTGDLESWPPGVVEWSRRSKRR